MSFHPDMRTFERGWMTHDDFKRERDAEGGGKPRPAGVGEVPMLRAYNPWTGEHLYTDSADEVRALAALGWANEDVGWYALATSSMPVYRLYNPHSGDHHYTPDDREYDELGAAGWRQEGVAFYSDDSNDPNSVAVGRLFNPYVEVGTHHYTTSRAEYEGLPAFGWVQEGVAWYALR